MAGLSFFYEIWEFFVTHSPSNRFFSSLRYRYFKPLLLHSSGPFSSMTGLCIPFPERVSIGTGVSINQYVLIDGCCGGKITIGNNVLIGPYVLLQASDHRFSSADVPIKDQGYTSGEIVIQDDCWIGAHVTITKDVTIGRGSVIGANSVVTRNIPPYSIAAGNPARVIRSRSSNDIPGSTRDRVW